MFGEGSIDLGFGIASGLTVGSLGGCARPRELVGAHGLDTLCTAVQRRFSAAP